METAPNHRLTVYLKLDIELRVVISEVDAHYVSPCPFRLFEFDGFQRMVTLQQVPTELPGSIRAKWSAIEGIRNRIRMPAMTEFRCTTGKPLPRIGKQLDELLAYRV